MNTKKNNNNEKANQRLIEDMRTILLQGKVTTQDGICASMVEHGHTVNQSKVSRLLRKIGAVKTKNERGEIVYRLPHEPAPPTTSCQLSSLIIDVVANEVNIIVYTSPGSAQLIARILDYNKDHIDILGTIAGDDAVFIAPASTKEIHYSIKKIRELLFS